MNSKPTDEQQAVIDSMIRAIKNGRLELVPDVIALFNSRPLRRHDDMRIQGWSAVLPE